MLANRIWQGASGGGNELGIFLLPGDQTAISLDRDGNTITTITGVNGTEFDAPKSTDGSLYYIDPVALKVTKINPKTGTKTQTNVALSSPRGVGLVVYEDADMALISASQSTFYGVDVRKISDGSQIQFVSSGRTSPNTIGGVDKNKTLIGNLAKTGGDYNYLNILNLSTAGHGTETELAKFNFRQYIGFAGSELLAVMNGQIRRISYNGSYYSATDPLISRGFWANNKDNLPIGYYGYSGNLKLVNITNISTLAYVETLLATISPWYSEYSSIGEYDGKIYILSNEYNSSTADVQLRFFRIDKATKNIEVNKIVKTGTSISLYNSAKMFISRDF